MAYLVTELRVILAQVEREISTLRGLLPQLSPQQARFYETALGVWNSLLAAVHDPENVHRLLIDEGAAYLPAPQRAQLYAAREQSIKDLRQLLTVIQTAEEGALAGWMVDQQRKLHEVSKLW